jgi:hypothetical protein
LFLEHEYGKLAAKGLVPKTKSWPKMQRELRYLQVAVIAQRLLEERGVHGVTFNEFKRAFGYAPPRALGHIEDIERFYEMRIDPDDDGPDAAA